MAISLERALDGNIDIRMEIRQVGIVRTANDTADVSIVNRLVGTGDNGAVDRQVLNLRAVGGVGAGDPAEQAAIERYRGLAAVVDGKMINGVIPAVEGTGKLLRSGADGRPLVTGEVDIGRQDAGELGAAAVDLLGEPCQLCAGADEVNAVFVGGRFRGGLAVPSVLGRLADGELDGQDAVFDLCCVSRAELEGAGGADIAELLDGVGIRWVLYSRRRSTCHERRRRASNPPVKAGFSFCLPSISNTARICCSEQASRLSSNIILPSVIGSSRSFPPSRFGTLQNQQRFGQPLEVIT